MDENRLHWCTVSLSSTMTKIKIKPRASEIKPLAIRVGKLSLIPRNDVKTEVENCLHTVVL